MVLESVETADGLEVASLSGASINPDSAVTNISLLENDFPYGLLQISGRGDANSGDRFTIPILNSPATVSVIIQSILACASLACQFFTVFQFLV